MKSPSRSTGSGKESRRCFKSGRESGPPNNRFQHSFTHIFGGGYAAGYYSYKWAEVLSADAWSAFEEEGTLSTTTGRRLRQEVFERGGSRTAMENFVAFRGREPSLDALMRHQGMTLESPRQSA